MGRKDKRLFARLDLDYADHPKVAGLSDGAFRAHVEMILHARKYMTDGVIGKRFAKRFASESLSELLTNANGMPGCAPLLSENENGDYVLHGYADMNDTKAEIEARTLANTENGRKGGLAKKRNAKQIAKQTAKQTAKRLASETLSEKRSENVAETETETETYKKEITNVISKEKTKRGTRLKDGWIPPRNAIDEMRAECPGIDLEASTRTFVDYWLSVPGQRGVKLDWVRTWRNWIRKEFKDTARRTPASPARPPQPSRAAQGLDLARRLQQLEQGGARHAS